MGYFPLNCGFVIPHPLLGTRKGQFYFPFPFSMASPTLKYLAQSKIPRVDHRAAMGPQPQFGRESRIGRIPKEGRP